MVRRVRSKLDVLSWAEHVSGNMSGVPSLLFVFDLETDQYTTLTVHACDNLRHHVVLTADRLLTTGLRKTGERERIPREHKLSHSRIRIK